MFNDPALKGAAVAAVRALKAQFNSLAPKYPTLRHYYVIQPEGSDP